MKSTIGAYIAGGMMMLGVWLVYENRQKLESMMKNMAAKADEMLQEMKCCKSEQCCNLCKLVHF